MARDLADQLASDIELCKDREEHVRITARANQAENLAQQIHDLMVSNLAANPIDL
jgi:hypothetical protein